jgi:hypothetical protein
MRNLERGGDSEKKTQTEILEVKNSINQIQKLKGRHHQWIRQGRKRVLGIENNIEELLIQIAVKKKTIIIRISKKSEAQIETPLLVWSVEEGTEV